MKLKFVLLSLALAAASSFSAQAVLIVSYSSVDSGVVSGNIPSIPGHDWHDNLIDPPGFKPATGSGVSFITGSGPTQFNLTGYGSTIDLTKYAGFQISVEPGYQFTLTDFVYNNASGDPTGSFQWGYRIDLNNDGDFSDGAAEGWTLGRLWTSADGADFGPNRLQRPKTWTFAAPIVTTGAIEFGVFGTGTGIQGAAYTLNGSIAAVPEPSAAVLGALGCLALLRRRR